MRSITQLFILSTVLLVFLSCRSVEKSNETTTETREETEVVQSDSIVRDITATEKIERTTVDLSNLSFRIIPSKQDTMPRTYVFEDKNGNKLTGIVNPHDTIDFRQSTVTVDQFNQMKELKEYYERRAITAEKKWQEIVDKNLEEVRRKPNPFKWFWVAIVTGILIYVISILWPKR